MHVLRPSGTVTNRVSSLPVAVARTSDQEQLKEERAFFGL